MVDITYNPLYFLLGESIACLIFTILLYFYFARKDTNVVVSIVSIFIWFSMFVLVVLLPIDIYYSRLSIEKKDDTQIEKEKRGKKILRVIYGIIYWSIFILTWVALPILQEYILSGQFTRKAKFIDAIKKNLIFYGVSLGIGLVAIIIFLFWIDLSFETFYNASIFIGNLFGFLLLMVCFGYSLVYIPKKIYKNLKLEEHCQFLEYTAGKLYDSLTDSQCQLSDYGYQAKDSIKDLEASNIEGFEKYIDFLKGFVKDIQDNENVYDITLTEGKSSEKPLLKREKDIINFHAKSKGVILDILRINTQMEEIYQEWILYKSILKCSKKEILAQDKEKLHSSEDIPTMNISKYQEFYYLKVRPVLFWILIILTIIYSFVITVSEITILFQVISDHGSEWTLFGLLITSVKSNIIALHFICIIFLGIFFFLSFFAMFRMKLSGFCSIYGGRQTDDVSLLFLSNNMSRIAFPLCINFIQIISTRYIVQSAAEESKSSVMETDYMNLFKNNPKAERFQIYFFGSIPLLLIIIISLNFFDVFNKIANFLGFSAFGYQNDNTQSFIEDGRDFLMKKCKNKSVNVNKPDKKLELKVNEASSIEDLLLA